MSSKSWIVKKCKKIFYHLFNSVKYLYLPSDTFRKHVERHVTRRKLSLKLTGYCRQTSYTDSAVVFTLLPAVAWVLKSQFAPGYMHFNICFKGVSGKIGIFHIEKLLIEVFWFFCLSRSWQWAGATTQYWPRKCFLEQSYLHFHDRLYNTFTVLYCPVNSVSGYHCWC